MCQFKRSLALLLIGVMASGLAIALSTEAANARSRSATHKAQARVSIVQKLVDLFRKRKLSGTTRSGTVCLVTPNQSGKRQLWSDRPLFVWQSAAVDRIRVQLARGGAVVWDKTLTATQTSVVYSGAALQPGKTYEIVLLNRQGKDLIGDKDMLPKFTPLDVRSRTDLTEQLNMIERQLLAKQKTIEEITTAKVEYLLQENFISDAVQIVYSAQNRSPELREITQQIAEMTCGKQEESSALR